MNNRVSAGNHNSFICSPKFTHLYCVHVAGLLMCVYVCLCAKIKSTRLIFLAI